jgi:maleylacetoacetate isomerase
VLEDGERALAQSLAIMEYLDETRPEPPLLPKTPVERARVRALAQAIACEIHPLNNTRVLAYLTGTAKLTEDAKNAWYHHWIATGFQALEARLAGNPATGRFCHGDAPGLADCCLVPQVANARRFKCDLAPYPTLVVIDGNCRALDAFQRAAPERQPDAE